MKQVNIISYVSKQGAQHQNICSHSEFNHSYLGNSSMVFCRARFDFFYFVARFPPKKRKTDYFNVNTTFLPVLTGIKMFPHCFYMIIFRDISWTSSDLESICIFLWQSHLIEEEFVYFMLTMRPGRSLRRNPQVILNYKSGLSEPEGAISWFENCQCKLQKLSDKRLSN